MKEFDGFAAFGRHLQRVAALGEEVTGHLAKQGAEVIAQDAKSRFGQYQDGGGGFPAWANLAEATVEDRLRKGFTPDDPLLRTGALRDSIGIQQEGGTAVVGSPDPVMLYQEQGTEPGTWGHASTSGIPPRPVLGPAAFGSRHRIEGRLAVGVMAWIAGLSWKRPPVSLTGSSER